MHNELLAQLTTGGNYISVWKLAVFVGFFGFWAWVGQWINKDTMVVKTKRAFWNSIYLMSGVLVLALWLLLPAPVIVGLGLFLVTWAMTAVIYVLHRNARVPKNETVLTPTHIKWLLSVEDRQRKKHKARLEFISVNDNVLPMPYRDEPEYPGFLSAEELLHDMWKRRVSHAVMIPFGENYQLRYVIDGIATVVGERTHEEATDAIEYLKAVAGLDVRDHRRPQEGSFFTIRTGESDTGWRINTSGSRRGEQLSLEKIEEKKAFKIDALGLHPDQLEAVQEAIEQEKGIILITGMKGSGVSTTAYALVRKHDAFIRNIHTLESEYLMELDNITQTLTDKSPNAKSTVRQLQSVLHSDPDVVLVGFCDSPEMARIGTKTARMGKKLYFCLPASNCFQALSEWIKLVGENDKVAESLTAITNQKLIRVLCHECREAYTPDATMLKKLNLPANKIKQFYRPPPEIEYDKRGNPILCPNCHGTGYFGRTAVFETLIISDASRKLIAEGATSNVISTQCRKERMLYLQEQALRKVIDGTTSIQEVLRITQQPGRKVVKQRE